jgi:predicted transcriptional regulator
MYTLEGRSPTDCGLQGKRSVLIVALGIHALYDMNMADSKTIDPFISAEEEVEVDAATAAAIDRGIQAADEGRVVSSEEVRKLIPNWISKFSTPNRP